MDAQKACMFHGSHHQALGSTLEHVPLPWMVSIFNTLAVPNAFAWWDYFCERKRDLFAHQGWEVDEGQTLSQFCPTCDKESWGETAALLSLTPPFNKAPIDGRKTADASFLFTLRLKYLTLRLSLKGQASLNLVETPFRIHTFCAILGSVQLSSLLQ